MVDEMENLANCIEMIQHHTAPHKADLLFRRYVGSEVLKLIADRFVLVRRKGEAAAKQLAKIRQLCEENGYGDVIALLDEEFVCGQK
jgi:hypothetical protein